MTAMFDPPFNLHEDDVSGLIATMVECARVRRRSQFFDWSQSGLQGLLPHRILLCGVPRGTGSRMFYDYFYSTPVPVSSLARLCHASQGLAAEMLRLWLASGGEPVAFSSGASESAIGSVADELQSLNLGDALVHGIPSSQSPLGVHCFFAFVSMGKLPQRRERDLAQAIVPHAFGAYCRALMRDRPAGASVDCAVVEALITDREVEILRWVREGKSNQEIGMILSISPLTVKNHIQKILRKLQASNRAQAVSKAISMRLLGAGLLPGPMMAQDQLVSNG